MVPPIDWQSHVKGVLKAELKRRDFSYQVLSEKLAARGVKESQKNISNKLSRGSFSAVFFVQCLLAIGCRSVEIDQK
jgi:hypothetical protein